LLTDSDRQEDDEGLWETEKLLVGFRPWKKLKQRILDQVLIKIFKRLW
jgi:hypothetical protein